MKTICVIDADVLAYRAAAANESRSIVVTHKVSGQVTEHAHRTAFKEHIKGIFEPEEFNITDRQEAQDLSFALHGMKQTMASIMKACNADDKILYISGDNNFRLELPLPTRYKSNRADGLRPLQLQQCKDYLIKQHRAIVVHGMEADDMLAHKAYEGTKDKGVRFIQVTNDKDSYSTDGWLYDWTKMDKPERIKGFGGLFLTDKKKVKGRGRKWLWFQILYGDRIDGLIPYELSGKKFGELAAFKLLNICQTDRECVEVILKKYKEWYAPEITYKAWNGETVTKSYLDMIDMYANGVFMKRFAEDKFEIRKVTEKLGIEL